MTYLEVLDSAVKIGLGALIAGLFSLIGSRHAREHELAKERLRRKADRLEDAFAKFSECDAAIQEYVRELERISDIRLPRKVDNERKDLFDALRNQLGPIRTRLDQIAALTALLDQRELTASIQAYSGSLQHLTVNAFELAFDLKAAAGWNRSIQTTGEQSGEVVTQFSRSYQKL